MQAGKFLPRLTLILLAGLIWGLLVFLLTQAGSVHAASSSAESSPPGPDRYSTVSVDITLYAWWLADWKNNDIHCSFWVDHAGLPYDGDVISACGQELYDEWKAKSTACDQEDITTCNGYYFIEVASKPSKKDVPLTLPPPEVWVSLEGCNPDLEGWCTQQATLVLTGKEPLPNESITGIHGIAGGDPFTCEGDRCEFTLEETNVEGLRLQFWAYSTYGDSSKPFEAILRVLADGESGERLTQRWYVDVLSTQWIGQPIASCAQSWESFPPPGGLPDWLTTPATSEELQSNIPYAYLAGNLISQGVVDVSSCPDNGLLPEGTASACGLQAAKPAVEEWQNRFDKLIFEVAQDNEVPAQLLKNLFSRESQFWPGVFRNSDDVGLGQLTDNGADTALLWNPSFYNQFCPLILNKNICDAKGFANLKPSQQTLLRSALVNSVDARCAECPLGLDLSRADFSVEIFGRTLLANCEQAGKIIRNVTQQAPGIMVSYEDLWRLTLVNYNAGPGCLSEAIEEAYSPEADSPLDWAGVLAALDKGCQGAIDYVDDITQTVIEPEPTPTPAPTNNEENG